jgi:hypothetical protein
LAQLRWPLNWQPASDPESYAIDLLYLCAERHVLDPAAKLPNVDERETPESQAESAPLEVAAVRVVRWADDPQWRSDVAAARIATLGMYIALSFVGDVSLFGMIGDLKACQRGAESGGTSQQARPSQRLCPLPCTCCCTPLHCSRQASSLLMCPFSALRRGLPILASSIQTLSPPHGASPTYNKCAL